MQDTQNAVTDQATLVEQADALSQAAATLSSQADILAGNIGSYAYSMSGDGGSFLVTGLTVFVLACFVGYYVVWKVTPALHSPLMAITNAISSVIIVGALIAAGPATVGFSSILGFLAVVLASINIFGGFIVTRRMLHMFKKR